MWWEPLELYSCVNCMLGTRLFINANCSTHTSDSNQRHPSTTAPLTLPLPSPLLVITVLVYLQPRQMDRGASRMQGNPAKSPDPSPGNIAAAENASKDDEEGSIDVEKTVGNDVTEEDRARVTDVNACASSSSSSNSLRWEITLLHGFCGETFG